MPADGLPEIRPRLVDPRVRRLGVAPNAACLLPADVLLVRGAGWVANAIRTAQRARGFAAGDADWSHVALHVGDGIVIDARPGHGVSLTSLAAATFGRHVLVRRAAGLSLIRRYQIVVSALGDLGERYSLATVPRLAWMALRGADAKASPAEGLGGVTICSTLVGRAFLESGLTVSPGRDITWPADLSHTANLVDVQACWVAVR